MSERIILVEGIDPVILYGVNNSKYDLLVRNFPTLRIIARGQEIKAIGNDIDLDLFEEKINQMVEHYTKYRTLSEAEVEDFINNTTEVISKAEDDTTDVLVFGNHARAIKARTVNQQILVDKYAKNDLLFAIGPAGSGKTYTAIALAVRALKNKEVKRIILTRPAVEAGERLGFLPGDMKEKLDPYLQPLYDALHDMIPPRKLIEYMEDGTVQIAPLAFMRGRTLDNAFVILDEAQNTTLSQMKMFLTRMGKNAKFIVTGDVTQIDLPRKEDSGLVKTLKILDDVKGIAIVQFDTRDIIRHKLVKYIVNAFESLDAAPANKPNNELITP
ncbi:MAG: PhoH family protein [Bacteroidales bacterium]|nr:PhoH family protein [Bacteroidales bacterium]MBN2748613.1 PhoH family protein [Bacteroidales bacterium]